MLEKQKHDIIVNLKSTLPYLMRSRKASAGLTCSIFSCLVNSSLEPLPGWMMSTMTIPMNTAMIVVVV